MRNMSFALTTEQFKSHTKTVTRRKGWKFLKAGDLIRGVEKAMGLQPGEKIVPLGVIRIVSTRLEPLCDITQDDVIKEGFPDWTPSQFINMLVNHYQIQRDHVFNRIEFEYIEAKP